MAYDQRHSEAFSNFPLLLDVMNEDNDLPFGISRCWREWSFIYGQDNRRLRADVYRSDGNARYNPNGLYVTTRVAWPPLSDKRTKFICNEIHTLVHFNQMTANNYARFIYAAVDAVLRERGE